MPIRQRLHWPQPAWISTVTRSPIENSSAPGPNAAIVPMYSCPGVQFLLKGNPPWTRAGEPCAITSRSVAQMATASMRTNTSARRGIGTGFCVKLSSPGSPSTHAHMVSGTGRLAFVFTPSGAYILASFALLRTAQNITGKMRALNMLARHGPCGPGLYLAAGHGKVDVIVLVVSDPSLLLVECKALHRLGPCRAHGQFGLQPHIKDHPSDADAVGASRSIEGQQVLAHGLKVDPVCTGAPGVVEFDGVAELIEGPGRQFGNLAIQCAHRHVKIDRGAVGMRLVWRETTAPRPSALGVDEAQFWMRLAQFLIGIAHGLAHGLVNKGAAEQEAEQAVGAIIVSRIGQPAAAFEMTVDDRAVTDARAAANKPEPGDVGGKRNRNRQRRKAGREQGTTQGHLAGLRAHSPSTAPDIGGHPALGKPRGVRGPQTPRPIDNGPAQLRQYRWQRSTHPVKPLPRC